ncbi:MAG: hypothetical protein AAFV80_16460, partial [Bacteroidota bacterium]
MKYALLLLCCSVLLVACSSSLNTNIASSKTNGFTEKITALYVLINYDKRTNNFGRKSDQINWARQVKNELELQ